MTALIRSIFLMVVFSNFSGAVALDCKLISDTKTQAIPPVAKPGYLKTIVDPTFGSKITRITGDPGTPIANISGGVWGEVSRHHYSKSQAWNADGTLFYIDRNTGGTPSSSIFLDGRTFSPLFTGKSKGKPSGGDVRWHPTRADIMIFVGGNQVVEWNVRAGTKAVLATFAGYSDFRMGPSEGNLSYDGQMVAVAAKNSAGRQVVFAFNLVNKKKYPDIDVSAFSNDLDWGSVSASGRYIVIQHDADASNIYDLNGKLLSTWPEYGKPSHYDLTMDASGEEYAVGVNKDSSGGLIVKRRLRDGVATSLTTGGYASHTSTRNILEKGWAFATYNHNYNYPPYVGEIVAMSLDQRIVYRIAHHHGIKTDYLTEIHASPSPDGRRIAFASNWDNRGGRPVQTYIADIRDLCASTTTPSPSPTPEPTPHPSPTPTTDPSPTPAPNASASLAVPIKTAMDDLEERTKNGYIPSSSSDLELVVDDSYQQVVGLRFTGLNIPKNALITKAYIQFTVDEPSSASTEVTIRGQAVDNAPAFTTAAFNISSRSRTNASAQWSIAPWVAAKDAGAAQQTPSLVAVVQELVNRSGWTSGNSMAFIIEGNGSRTARAYDSDPSRAAVLKIEYQTVSTPSPADTLAPSVSLTSPADGAVVKGVVQMNASASDNVGVKDVTFRWDSEVLASDAAAPYGYAWDTTKFADGFYTLTAVASDHAGNQKISNLATVRVQNAVDPTPPPPPLPPPSSGALRRVPQDYSTIQAAVNAAANGDTVLIAPGTYTGGIKISGKAITLASQFHTTGSASYIDQTIISDGNPMLTIAASAAHSRVIGLSFKSGSYAVVLHGYGEVLNNKFTKIGADSVSFEAAGGLVRDNTFINPSDDAIDADGPLSAVIERNVITGAGDDGIEIRNFNDSGPLQTIVIRGNRIENCKEDGVQIIDYSAVSNRRFIIERNLILNSADAGLGIMDNGETVEDFRAASMPERVHVLNNTFSGNRYGISGGDNMAVVNNIIVGSTSGMKGVDGQSVVSYNLFYDNTTNYQSSNVVTNTTILANPTLATDFKPLSGSSALNKGVSNFVYQNETILNLPSSSYSGSAPDLGAYEFTP